MYAKVKSGDVFVIKTDVEAAIEFMVVRELFDDKSLVLMVPMDDAHPFVGPPDFDFPKSIAGRPLIARCGQTFWMPKKSLLEKEGYCHKVFSVSKRALSLVRAKIAKLARGMNYVPDEQLNMDCDPNYEDWIQLVTKARIFVEEHS